MFKIKIKIILVITLLIGIFILIYPFISQYFNSFVQSKTISDYDNILSKKESNDYEKMLEAAFLYNQELVKLEYPFLQYKQIPNYDNLLNIDNHGMMGYITIDKIKVKLPIYHGTSSSTLNNAVGHLTGSSLPIGGVGTHSVLSAHTGLPTAKLFTNLNKLELGDTFIVTVIDKNLTYQIDQILMVKPTDVSTLEIDKNKDYITLITCAPYGLNTHRLLVRGTRVNDISKKELIITKDAEAIDRLVVTVIIAISILIILMLYLMIKPVKTC